MKHVQLSDSKVIIPSHKLFQISYLFEKPICILADDFCSAFEVFHHYFGVFPNSMIEVANPDTDYLFLVCDSTCIGKTFTSLCRVPLHSYLSIDGYNYRLSIESYFRFNIASSIEVVFE